MKRMIRASSKSAKTVKNRGYNAAKKFKQKYPKAYEVLGK